MYPPIRCLTCGNLVGHVYRLFQEIRLMKNMSDEEKKDLIKEFELIHIKCMCCKKILATTRQFNDFLRE